MKHLITIHEVAFKDIAIETGIDDPAKSNMKAFDIARELYENGTIDMSMYGDVDFEDGSVVSDEKLKELDYVDVYNEECGEDISQEYDRTERYAEIVHKRLEDMWKGA